MTGIARATAVLSVWCCAACAMQMSVYVGPRVDAAGNVGLELGVAWGGGRVTTPEAPAPTDAILVSGESGMGITTTRAGCRGCASARESQPPDRQMRAAIRGVVEWVHRPPAPLPREAKEWTPIPGAGWRAGVYGGAEKPGEHGVLGVIGLEAAVSPLVWWRRCCGRGAWTPNQQWRSVGVQLALEAIPGEIGGRRFVGRAVLLLDVVDSAPEP